MPPKKKARSSIDVSPSKSPRTPSANGAASRAKSKPIVPKAKVKAVKKEAASQTNTLFDFYPNLSKNAPLFRAPLAGDEPAVQSNREPRIASYEDDDSLDREAAATISHPTREGEIDQSPEGNKHSSAFGPFSLDDDFDDDKALANGEVPQLTTSDIFSSSVDSTAVLNTKTPSTDTNQFDDAEGEDETAETGDAGSSGGIEIDLQEERDRFENADDEENEDEQWSWQEYNSENFGMHVSRDEAVLCPVCGESIIALPEHDRSAHVNRCLDLPPPADTENQINGAPLIDSTVKREMSDTKSIPKEESFSTAIKREETIPESPFVKAEHLEDDIEDWSSPEVKRENSPVKKEVKTEPDIKNEHKDTKPSLITSTSNAFDKIMVNHTEEKQWADAARTENAQRGTKYKTRVCPFYKILSPFPIAVDAFKYGIVPGVEGYYLTHFHSDHYGGLSSTWDAGPIYCSSITGSLVIQQLKVRPEYVVKLPMNETVDINGTLITLIDANHCPGSTLFLFEGHARGRQLRYLHCGDFRATPTQLLHPAVRGKKIDSLYLDTTYLSPKYAFPSQEDVIEACSHVCRDLAGLLPDGSNPVADARNASALSKFLNQKSSEAVASSLEKSPEVKKKPRGRLLVVVGTYSIGKERIVLGIAKALNSKIFAAQRKRDILSCLEDPDLLSRLTNDPLEAQVHMTYLQEIRAETLADYLTQFQPHFSRIVGFRGTGWTYSPPKTRFLDNPSVEQIMSWNPRYTFANMSPGRGSNSVAACYGVPYSEHSSFRELMCFCLSSDLGRVIPTVNVGSERSRKLMKSWIDKWAQEVRKNGLRRLIDGQVEWR